VANLVSLYPKTTSTMWEPKIILSPVNFVFYSQLLPPLSNKLWQCEALEVMSVLMEKLCFTKA
jgi:hypothetical protein